MEQKVIVLRGGGNIHEIGYSFTRSNVGNELWLSKVLEGKLIKMDSAYVKKSDGGKAELISRNIREVNNF